MGVGFPICAECHADAEEYRIAEIDFPRSAFCCSPDDVDNRDDLKLLASQVAVDGTHANLAGQLMSPASLIKVHNPGQAMPVSELPNLPKQESMRIAGILEGSGQVLLDEKECQVDSMEPEIPRNVSSLLYTQADEHTEDAKESPPEPTLIERAAVVERARASLHTSPIAAVAPVAQVHPDFTGTWKMVDRAGDFDGFMKEMGVGWVLRKAAGAVGFGVNVTFHEVLQTKDAIKVETKNPKGTFLKNYSMDASEQDDVDPVTKEPIKVVPYWSWEEGSNVAILVIEAFKPQTKGDPIQMPLTRRLRDGERMILEAITPQGIKVKRIFNKI